MLLQDRLDLPGLGEAQPPGVGQCQVQQPLGLLPVAVVVANTKQYR